uniref:Uncharacterized protein n=1 Tax=Plectus sambesii TaxID=2011161 RepID=A0A914XS23_9BILA
MTSALLISLLICSLVASLTRPSEGVPLRQIVKRRVGVRLPHLAQSLSQKQMATLMKTIALKKTIHGFYNFFHTK